MKKRIFIWFVFLMLLQFTLISFVIAADLPKNVAVTINGFPIYNPEVDQELQAIMPMNQNFHGKMSNEKMEGIRKEALQKLIDLELKYQDALSKNVKLLSDERKNVFKIMSKRFDSNEKMQAAIKAAGFTTEIFEHFIERPLLVKKITKKEVDDKILVTDEMVKKYYDSNISRYSKPKAYRASQILLKIDPSLSSEDKNKIRIRAEVILKKIKAGADFSDTASKESEDMSYIKGGDLGYFHAGQVLEEFENSIKTMKVGETSELIETLYGLHIIKLTDIQPPRQILFDEIKEKIKKDLVSLETKRYTELWVTGINKKSIIKYSVVK